MTEEKIRSDIRAQLSRLFGARAGAFLIEEMEVCSGRARVDMAVICDRLIGIEIKGPRDDLDRLPLQADRYSKCFDQVVLVVDSELATDALTLIPKWWGVVIGTREADSYTYRLMRRPRRNPYVDVDSVLSLLWREEMEILWREFLPQRSLQKASRKRMRDQLLSEGKLSRLKEAGVELLRNRKAWRSLPIV